METRLRKKVVSYGMKRAEHVQRMVDESQPKRAGKVEEGGRRRMGRSMVRWEDSVKRDLGWLVCIDTNGWQLQERRERGRSFQGNHKKHGSHPHGSKGKALSRESQETCLPPRTGARGRSFQENHKKHASHPAREQGEGAFRRITRNMAPTPHGSKGKK